MSISFIQMRRSNLISKWLWNYEFESGCNSGTDAFRKLYLDKSKKLLLIFLVIIIYHSEKHQKFMTRTVYLFLT